MTLFDDLTPDQIWIGIGLIGQSMFFFRFLFQWLASERAGESVIPTAFWYFSIAGAFIVLAYAIYKSDPVFIIGQAMGLTIYSRNLFFIYRNHKATKVAVDDLQHGRPGD